MSIMGETGLRRSTVMWYLAMWRRELRNAGRPVPLCRCGRPFGHKAACPEYGDTPRRAPPPDFSVVAPTLSLEKLKALYRAGIPTLRRWFAEIGTPLPSPRCRPPISDIRVRIEALAWDGYSCASIKSRIQVNPATVHRYFYGMWKQLRAEGLQLPNCRCGQSHDHRAPCFEKVCGGSSRRAVPPDFREVAPYCSLRQLSEHYCASFETVSRWMGECADIPRRAYFHQIPDDFADRSPFLSVTQLSVHYCVSRRTIYRWFRDRPNAKRCQRITRPLAATGRVSGRIADPLYQEIEQLVPSGISADIREDVISELYVAVLEGSLSDGRLRSCGRAIMNRTIDKCGACRWTAPRSLDAPIAESRKTLADIIADDRAMDDFNALFDEDRDDDY